MENNSDVVVPEQEVMYQDLEWVMRNNVTAVCRLNQDAMTQMKKSFKPVLDFVMYTFHLWNAQCVAEDFGISEEERDEWFKANERAMKLVEEGLNEIHLMKTKPTPEFQKMLEEGAGERPIYILPQLTPITKGTTIEQ